MQKKFFDIIPPKEQKSVEIPVKKSLTGSKTVEPVLFIPPAKKKMFFRNGLVGIIAILVLILTIGFLLPSNIDIEIWPKIESVDFTETIIVDLNTVEVDLENSIIPGLIANNEKTGSQEFTSTGKATKETKAEGTITVYNAYSTSSRTLIPSRFVSADGKLFWSTKKITIPGTHYEGGKLIPGKKEVQVIAAETGPEYNISATTFALPALAGTALYTAIYAKSFSSMTGGYIGEVSQITQSDLDDAENVLTKKLKSENANFLKESLSRNFMLPSETIIHDISDIESSQPVDSKFDSFSLSAKIISTGLAFKKSDVDSFVSARINPRIKENHIVQEGTLKVKYILEEVDLEAGKMVIRLEIEAKTYANIVEEDLKKAIMGKTIKEAKIFLSSMPEIDRIELKSGLSLKKIIPENMDKVKVRLRVD